MNRMTYFIVAIVGAVALIVGCGSQGDPVQTLEPTPTPTIGPTVDVESVVRRLLEEQRSAETPNAHIPAYAHCGRGVRGATGIGRAARLGDTGAHTPACPYSGRGSVDR